jgi:hypothetical protein
MPDTIQSATFSDSESSGLQVDEISKVYQQYLIEEENWCSPPQKAIEEICDKLCLADCLDECRHNSEFGEFIGLFFFFGVSGI